MKIVYFDCIAGASGDMLLGALVDADLGIDRLRKSLEALKLAGFEIRANQVLKTGFRATKVDIVVQEDVPSRRMPGILSVIENSELSKNIKSRARKILERLGW